MVRPSYKIDANNPGSELAAETAAAMAASSIIFSNDDPVYSDTLLAHAIQLYNFADNYRGKYSDVITDASAFYNSWSGFNDELVWGAIWLYMATNDTSWLNKAEAEYANLNNETGQSVKSYKWGLAWDDKAYGCYVLLAKITGAQQYKLDSERHLDYWTDGYNSEQITYTPGGLAWLTQWGSLRHAANTAFLAFVYSDVTTDSLKSQKYYDFAASQINYMLGNNPNNRSYVVGFGNNPPINPHHRTAHGTWTNNLTGPPTNNRHIIYGALVGGPGSDDSYTDDRGDYISNEVACDYNAGFTGALARLVTDFGGSQVVNFPVPEIPQPGEEYFNEAKINATGSLFTEVSVWATNHSSWPAAFTDQVCFQYFVDLNEGIAAGYNPGDYIVSMNQSPSGATVSGLQWVEDSVYYVEVCMPGTSIYPGGQSQAHREVQLRISLPTSAPASAWNPANDWSYFYNDSTAMNNSLQRNPRIPFYNNGVLLYGLLPDGTGANIPPEAIISASPVTGYMPLTVNFDATASHDPDGDTLAFHLDFADGGSDTTGIAAHTFTNPGNYSVILTVDDGHGGADSDVITISVLDTTPLPPVAVMTAIPHNGPYPLTVSFDASASWDPNADSLNYHWNFGDGSVGTGVTASHIYQIMGVFNATLIVDDGALSDTAQVTINAVNLAPVAAFSANPASGPPPLAVNLNASATTDANGDTLSFLWLFGDGNTGNGINVNHTYTSTGTYMATLVVTDIHGGTDTATTSIFAGINPILTVAYRTTDINPASALDNQIRPHFKIQNDDSLNVPMQELTLRYWYTREGTSAQQAWIDWAQIGAANITTGFVQLGNPVQNADFYLEVGFLPAAGSITPGGNSGEIQVRFNKTDWSNYDENNDYTFDPTKSTYELWEHVALYRNGVLIWGTEPGNTVPPACEPVAGLSTTQVTFSSARLNWLPVNAAHHRQIRGKRTGNPQWIYLNIPAGSPDYKDVYNLPVNTEFVWQIRSWCDASETDSSAWSPADTFTTGCFSPDSNWTDPVTATGARLNWNPVPETAGYEIQGRRIGASGMTTIFVGNGNTSFKDAWGLLPATAYEWRVRSWCDAAGINISEFTELDTFFTTSSSRINNTNQTDEVQVYPNPFSESTTILFQNSDFSPYHLQVFDALGKRVYHQQQIRGETVKLISAEFNPGIYFFELRGALLFRGKLLVK